MAEPPWLLERLPDEPEAVPLLLPEAVPLLELLVEPVEATPLVQPEPSPNATIRMPRMPPIFIASSREIIRSNPTCASELAAS